MEYPEEWSDVGWEALGEVARELLRIYASHGLAPDTPTGRAFLHVAEHMEEAVRRRDQDEAERLATRLGAMITEALADPE